MKRFYPSEDGDFGIAVQNGKRFYMMQHAYLDHNEDFCPIFRAICSDDKGKEYWITWEIDNFDLESDSTDWNSFEIAGI